MVKIAIAGGSGQVAREVIDVLAEKDHDITVISRKETSSKSPDQTNIKWAVSDYQDKKQLANILVGIHTVFSFIVVQNDPGNMSQKNLIDAAVEAGVKRFAPSEWGGSSSEGMPWAGKSEVHEYLRQINHPKKIIEYSLFQPGLFLNYLAHPHKTTTHLTTFPTQFDFENRRAIILDSDKLYPYTLTTVQDLANVVAAAVDYEGEWPEIGGVKGNEVTDEVILGIGERVRGNAFQVEKVPLHDAQAGVLNTSWAPLLDHHSIPKEQVEFLSKAFLTGSLVGISKGALRVSDDWNKLLPEYKFTTAEEFLERVWQGKE